MAAETVLVTGASSGIGRELAALFAADGCELVLTARREARLRELADELRERYGTRSRVLPADLADPAAGARLVAALDEAGVEVDVLVNNAGFGCCGPALELPLERQRDLLEVNVGALTELTLRLAAGMRARGRGGILNVASTAGFQPGPFMAVYYASKAYVLSFTEALAEELRGTEVRVTAFCPGPTATEFVEAADLPAKIAFERFAADAAATARRGYDGFRRGRVVVVPGLLNRVTTQAVRFAPRFLVRRVVRRLQGP